MDSKIKQNFLQTKSYFVCKIFKSLSSIFDDGYNDWWDI